MSGRSGFKARVALRHAALRRTTLQVFAALAMDPRDHDSPGGQARHQAIAIAMLVRTELESQGVLEPDEEADEVDED